MAELRLDEKTKAALIGLMPMSENGRLPFTPVEFTERGLPAEVIPEFDLGTWTMQQKHDYHERRKGNRNATQDEIKQEARQSIYGMRKMFLLPDFEPLEFKAETDGTITKDVFEQLPETVQLSLWFQAARMAGVIGPAAVLSSEEMQGLKS